jgi:hypothetical protein
MYDDFMSGYNSWNGVASEKPVQQAPVQQVPQNRPRINLEKVAISYDKSKMIIMAGPEGEKGEIYATGKMYIEFPDKRPILVRKFPSRPWGIRHMQKRGWVLV